MGNTNLKTDSEELRIVLLGKTGAGKSAAGNIILEKNKEFKIGGFSSGTERCEKKTGEGVSIVDTPGLFHTKLKSSEVVKEIQKGIKSIEPGPHVFLLVLRLNVFDKEVKKTLDVLKIVLQNAKHHTVVLFTHGNTIEKGSDVRVHKDVKNFIEESCEAHHVLNIKVKDKSQVDSLLDTLHKIKNDRPGGYSSEQFENDLIAMKKEMQSFDKKDWLSELEEGLEDPLNFVTGKFEQLAIKFSP